MKLAHMILGLLAQRPFTGYDLGKFLEQEGRFLRPRIHQSQIYRQLAAMVDSGWVEYEVHRNDGRPDSKTYRLTEHGEAELRAWVESPYMPSRRFHDTEFMERFLFGGPLDRDALVRLVRTELDARTAQVDRFRERDRHFGPAAPIPGVDAELAHRLGDLAHEQGAAAVDAWIDWLRRVLAELESEPKAATPNR